MNLLYSRLQALLPGLAAGPEEIASALTLAGVAVDRVTGAGADIILETDITTNRPDLLSHRGVARELSALYGLPLAAAPAPPTAAREPASGAVTITVEAPDACPRYSARVVKGVRVGPSPPWLRREVEACGLRSISNVVDATNFVLLELGHPLHAFDLDHLKGRSVVVRRPRGGERLTTLDGVDRALSQDDLVIADATRPVALAGVMGGQASEVTELTRDILIESAYFDPLTVRRMARRHKLRTEASLRFERQADVGATLEALDRAAALICETAGGTLLDGTIDCYPAPAPRPRVRLRLRRLDAILGVQVGAAQAQRILESIGFAVVAGDDVSLTVEVPSARHEVEREIDLIEEVGRLHGYDKIPATLPQSGVAPRGRTRAQQRQRLLRSILGGAGWSEAVTLSMVDGAREGLLATGALPVAISNPVSDKMGILRTTIIGGLLESAGHNLRNGAETAQLYELGHTFARAAGGVQERSRLTLLAASSRTAAAPLDELTVKGALELVGRTLRLPTLRADGDGFPAPLSWGDTPCGSLIRLPPEALDAYGLDTKSEVFAAEIDLQAVLDHDPGPPRYAPYSRFPASARDISVWTDGARYADLLAIIDGATSPLLESVQFVERYRDRKQKRHSFTLRLVYRHGERTLSAEEVQIAHQRILDALAADPRTALRM